MKTPRTTLSPSERLAQTRACQERLAEQYDYFPPVRPIKGQLAGVCRKEIQNLDVLLEFVAGHSERAPVFEAARLQPRAHPSPEAAKKAYAAALPILLAEFEEERQHRLPQAENLQIGDPPAGLWPVVTGIQQFVRLAFEESVGEFESSEPSSTEGMFHRLGMIAEGLRCFRALREGDTYKAMVAGIGFGACGELVGFARLATFARSKTGGRPPGRVGEARKAIRLALERGATSWAQVPRIWAKVTRADGGLDLGDGRLFRLLSDPDADPLEWEAVDPSRLDKSGEGLRLKVGHLTIGKLKGYFSEEKNSDTTGETITA